MRKEVTVTFNIDESEEKILKEGIASAINNRFLKVIVPKVDFQVKDVEEFEYEEMKNYVATIQVYGNKKYTNTTFFLNASKRDSSPNEDFGLGFIDNMNLADTNTLKLSRIRFDSDITCYNLKEHDQIINILPRMIYRPSCKLYKIMRTTKPLVNSSIIGDIYYAKLVPLEEQDKRVRYIEKYTMKHNLTGVMDAIMSQNNITRDSFPFYLDNYKKYIFKYMMTQIKQNANIKYSDKSFYVKYLKYCLTSLCSYRQYVETTDADRIRIFERLFGSFILDEDQLEKLLNLMFETTKHRDFYYELFVFLTSHNQFKEYLKQERIYIFKLLGAIDDEDLKILNDENEVPFIKNQLEYWTMIDCYNIKDTRKSDSWNTQILQRIIESVSSFATTTEIEKYLDEDAKKRYFKLFEKKLRENIAIKELGDILYLRKIIIPDNGDTTLPELILQIMIEELNNAGETNKMLLKSVLSHSLVVYYVSHDCNTKGSLNIENCNLKNYKNLRKELMNIKLS